MVRGQGGMMDLLLGAYLVAIAVWLIAVVVAGRRPYQ